MHINEAKDILRSYRASGADAADPRFAEALELTRKEPALGEWFERQQAFDRAMSRGLETVAPPDGLRDRILAARTAAPAPAAEPLVWRRRPAAWLGLAAAVVFLAAGAIGLWPEAKVRAADSSLAAFAIHDAQDPSKHGGKGEQARALNRALNKLDTKLGDRLPVEFDSLHDDGCRTVHVEGRNVLEMCFRREKVQFHCYIAKRADFPRLTAAEKPEVIERNGTGIATWIEDENLYIVISKPGRAPLDKLLPL